MYTDEELQGALGVIKCLARERNPLTGDWIKDKVFGDEKIKRSLKIACALIEEIIKNGGEVIQVYQPMKFQLTDEMYKKVKLSTRPIGMTEFIKNINAAVDVSRMQKLSSTPVTKWLTDMGYFEKSTIKVTRNMTELKPTHRAESIGIAEVKDINESTGEVKRTVTLSGKAQVFILQHMEEILTPKAVEFKGADGVVAGRLWSRDEEQRLISEFKKDVPLDEMAQKHGRTKGAISARLKKLGLIQNEF